MAIEMNPNNNKLTCIIMPNGTQLWLKNGQFHRVDGPAIICADGTQYWLKDGRLHREDGPVITYPDCFQLWYKNGCIVADIEVEL